MRALGCWMQPLGACIRLGRLSLHCLHRHCCQPTAQLQLPRLVDGLQAVGPGGQRHHAAGKQRVVCTAAVGAWGWSRKGKGNLEPRLSLPACCLKPACALAARTHACLALQSPGARWGWHTHQHARKPEPSLEVSELTCARLALQAQGCLEVVPPKDAGLQAQQVGPLQARLVDGSQVQQAQPALHLAMQAGSRRAGCRSNSARPATGFREAPLWRPWRLPAVGAHMRGSALPQPAPLPQQTHHGDECGRPRGALRARAQHGACAVQQPVHLLHCVHLQGEGVAKP